MDETVMYYANCDFSSNDPKTHDTTIPTDLSLTENQLVEILDSQDPRFYLVRTRPVNDGNAKIGWIPACFLESKTNKFGNSGLSYSSSQENASKQNYSLNEIIDTEQKYVKDLQFVIENYLQELSKLDCPTFIKEKKDIIFSNIEDIFAFHKILFLTQMVECSTDAETISKIFLKNRHSFELYITYIFNRQYSEATLNTYKALTKFFNDINKGMDYKISDYLNKPLERLLVYKKFLQEQIKYTVKCRKSSLQLQEAYIMLTDISRMIETRQLLNSILNLPIHLLIKLDKLYRFDVMYIKNNDNQVKERYLFLFKDTLIICKAKRKYTTESLTGTNISSSLTNSIEDIINSETLVFKSAVQLSSIKTIKLDNLEDDEDDDNLNFEMDINEKNRQWLKDLLETENLLQNYSSKLVLRSKNMFQKLAFLKGLKDNLLCLGYLEQSSEAVLSINEDKNDDFTRQHIGIEAYNEEDVFETNNYFQIDETKQISSLLKFRNEHLGVPEITHYLSPPPQKHPKFTNTNEYNIENLSLNFITNENRTDIDTYYQDMDDLHISEGSLNSESDNTLIKVSTRPKIIKFFDEATINEGNELLLTCQIEGYPKPKVNWYKDDMELNDNHRIKISQSNDGPCSLHIKNVTLDDSGTYKVVAKNFNGDAIYQTQIYIEPSPDNVFDEKITRLSKEDRSYAPRKGTVLELKCFVKEEDTRVNWLKGGENISNLSRDRYKFIERDKERILVINGVTEQDVGKYVCSSEKYSVTLYLTLNSDYDSNYRYSTSREGTKSRDTSIPRIIHKEIHINDKQRKSNVLEESIRWNSQNVLYDDKYGIRESSTDRVLLINDTNVKDGSDTYKTVLHLNINSYDQGDLHTSSVSSQYNAFNQKEQVFYENQNNAYLKYHFNEHPSNIILLKDNMKIWGSNMDLTQKDKYSLTRDGETSILQIKHLTANDSGRYTCKSKTNPKHHVEYVVLIKGSNNELEDRSQKIEKNSFIEERSFEINMPESLSPILESTTYSKNYHLTRSYENENDEDLVFTKLLEDYTDIDEGENCVLECSVNLYNTHAVWMKEDYMIDFDKPLTKTKYNCITEKDGRLHKLLIKNTSPEDCGIYACVVNGAIQTDTILNVNQDAPLKIINHLSDKTLNSRDTNGLELFVGFNKFNINDTSMYRIRWFINNREIQNSQNVEIRQIRNKTFLKLHNSWYNDRLNEFTVECSIKEFKIGLHSVELSTKCRIDIKDTANVQKIPLSFVKSLENYVEVPVDTNAELSVILNQPAHNVKWFKNNQPIQLDNNKYETFTDENKNLYGIYIRGCKPKDSGVYSIQIDGLNCSTEVKVNENDIKFSRNLNDQFIQPNIDTSLTLDCQLNRKPPKNSTLKPRWFKDDNEIFRSDKYDMVQEHNICALIIYELDDDDFGKYSCFYGNEKTECRVLPQFSLTKYLPNSVDLRESESCTLSFAINRPLGGIYSSAVTKWFKDGIEIKEDESKYWLIEHGTERSLSILDCDRKDTGLYKACIVDKSSPSQTNLVSTNSCLLNVQKLKVDYTTPLKRFVEVEEGDNVKLYCETLQENLKPKWFFNQVLIDLSDSALSNPKTNNKEIYSTSMQHFLIINDAKPEDTGDYSVLFGSDEEATCSLAVNSKKKQEIKPVKNSDLNFDLPLNNVVCKENEKIKLTCLLNRNIKKTDVIMLKKNHEKILSAVGKNIENLNSFKKHIPNSRVYLEDNEFTILFDQAKLNDSGNYELSVLDAQPDSDIRFAETSCVVDVQPVKRKSNFIKPPPETIQYIPDTVEDNILAIECVLAKNDMQIKWFKDGQEIPLFSEKYETISEGPIKCLLIHDFNENDGGKYYCQVEDECKETVVQSLKPLKTHQPRHEEVTVYEGRNLTTEIDLDTASNKEGQTYKWMKNGVPLPKSLTDEIEMPNNGKKFILKIDKIKKSDAGNYELFLSNADTKSPMKIAILTVNVTEKPIQIVKHLDISIIEKDLLFHCEISNPKKQNILSYWYKDGKQIGTPYDRNKYQPLKSSKNTDTAKIELLITNYDYLDSGLYELALSTENNPDYVEKTQFKLEIEQNPFKSSITVENDKLDEENSNLSLLFTAANPCYEINDFQWYKNGYPINLNSDKYTFEKTSPTEYKLTIKSLTDTDNAEYKCTKGSHSNTLIISGITCEKQMTATITDHLKNKITDESPKVNKNQNDNIKPIEVKITTDVKNSNQPEELTEKHINKKTDLKTTAELKDKPAETIKFEESEPEMNVATEPETIKGKHDFEPIEQPERVDENQHNKIFNEITPDATKKPTGTQNSETPQQLTDKPIIKENDCSTITEELADTSNITTASTNNEPEEPKKNEITKTEPFESKPDTDTGSKEDQNLNEINESIQNLVDNECIKEIEPNELSITSKILNSEEPQQINKKHIDQINNLTTSAKINNNNTLTVDKNKNDKAEPEMVVEIELVKNEFKNETDGIKIKSEADNEGSKSEKPESENVQEIVDQEKKSEETPLTVLESNWKPETVKDETDDLKLSLKLNKPINDPKSVVLYRNDKPIDSNDSPIVAVLNDNDNAVIDVIMKKLKPEDTGKYKLCLKSPETGKEVELASTNLTVNEEPIKVVEPLKADKDQYEEGNDVTLTVKLSKQLKDKDSCALWSSENKQLEDGVRKNIEKGEFKAEDNVFVYYLKIKSSQAKPDSGVYSLRLLSKPNESQSEFYNGTANVKIEETPLTVLESNWKPETVKDETDDLKLSLKLNKPINDPKSVVLYRNDKPIDSNDSPIVAVLNDNDNAVIDVIMKKLKPEDTGKYKLCLKSPETGKEVELASTNLTVNEEPIKVVEPLKADKDLYEEGNDVTLTVKLSKQLKDKDSCALWSSENKQLEDGVRKNIEKGEFKAEDNVFVYYLKIKSSQAKPDSGVYSLRLLSKPNESQSEFYNGTANVKIEETPLTVLESNWKPETVKDETDDLKLSLKLNKPINDPKSVVLYRNDKPIDSNDSPIVAVLNDNDNAVIDVIMKKLKPEDTGKYKLCLKSPETGKEVELASTNLTVNEEPIKVVEPLKADKDQYEEGNDVTLTVKLSKQLKDKDSCALWSSENKQLEDGVRKNIEKGEFKAEDNVFVYYLKIKSSQAKPDSGVYSLRLLSKPNESQSEFYNGTANVKIEETPLTVLESNWKPETVKDETDDLKLSLKLNKPINDPKSVVLYRNDKPIDSNDSPIVAVLNDNDNAVIDVIMKKLKPEDTGKYKLCLKSPETGKEVELASTNLTVNEEPIKVVEPLKADKDQYEEGNDVTLTVKLSKQLKDKDSCALWSSENKQLEDGVRKNIEKGEFKAEDNVFVYYLKIKSSQAKPDSGVYSLRLLSKPNESQSEFYNGTANVKIEETPLTVLESNWKPETVKDETDDLKLSLKLNKPINDPKSVVLYRNDKPIDSNDSPIVAVLNDNDNAVIDVIMKKLKPEDTGKYKLCLKSPETGKEVELASTNLTVNEEPIKVVEPLKADKDQYEEGNDVTLTVKLSKQLKDKDSCALWSSENKQLEDGVRKNIEKGEFKAEDNVFVYYLKIKSSQAKPDSGVYSLRLLSKPNESQSEFYNGTANVKIEETPLTVLESNWKPETVKDETDDLKLSLKLNKPINDPKSVVLYRNDKPIDSNDSPIVAVLNDNDNAVIDVIMKKLKPEDTGKYKLCLKSPETGKEVELASTNLTVNEEPIKVVEPLKADKDQYEEGNDVTLTVKLSKQLKDKDSCALWSSENKQLEDGVRKNIEKGEFKAEDNVFVYYLKIKSSQAKPDSGIYSLRLLSKPNESQSEFYNGTANVKIEETPLTVLESNWKPETVKDETDDLKLSLKLNKPINDPKSVVLYRNDKPIDSNDSPIVAVLNDNDNAVIDVIMKKLKPEDTGKYKLCLKSPETGKEVELASTNLTVNEEPIKVVEPLKADKDQYEEGNDVTLTVKLSKQLKDKDSCALWSSENKQLEDGVRKNIEKGEFKAEDNVFVYYLKIKSSQAKPDSGIYSLRLLSKPNESQSEFYNGTANVKIEETPLTVLESNWKPETVKDETDDLKLSLKLNKPINDPKSVVLYRNDKPIDSNDSPIVAVLNDNDNAVIDVIMKKLKPEDTGKYKLCLKSPETGKEVELASTNLTVNEEPIKVVEPLKADKDQYEEGNDVTLTVKLSKQLKDKDSCALWSSENKQLEDGVRKNIEKGEFKAEDNVFVYYLKIKSSQAKPDSGVYSLRLLSKPNESQSEFYNGTANVKIEETPLTVLESNWKPETVKDETDDLKLSLKLNKPINDPKSVVLYRNDKPIDSNDSPIVAVLNDNDNAVIDVIMKKLKPEDTGKYKLCLKSPETGKEVELASTNLTVNEEPIKVVEPLKADKDQYEEGNDVTLTVKLSKQLKDKDSCALWSSENKQLEDGVRKNIEKGEFKAEDNVFVYYLKIKSSQAKPDSGVYSLRLLSKPNESQSEFYNGTANVKIEETPLTVLESNWKPETVKDETDDLKLSLKLNKPINDPKSVVLYRNDKPIDSNDSPIVAVLNDNDNAVIDVIMKKLKPEDTGKYKLCLKSPETGKEVELASTNLTVNEEPIKVVEPLKADKDQYEEGNDVTLTVKLSKQLKDKDSCALWSSENKQLEDGVRKNIEKGEFKAEDNVFVYYLKIKSSQAKPDSGVYSLRLLSKPNESQSEFYNGTANVKIEETPLTVLESNWKPETVKDETDDLKLSLKLNKPINDPKSVVLYRNDKPIDSNDSPIVAVLNDNDNAVIDVIMKKLKPEDTGKYKLCLKSPETGKEVELASTNLTVNEEPIKVVEPLKADKDQYEEGNDVTLTVKLSKQLKDKDSCALWSSENKQLEDGVRKNIEKGEFKAEDNVFVYYLKIKSSQAKPDSGVYSLRLLSKPNESQSEFYNGTANVKIEETPLTVLESNWKPETVKDETDDLKLSLKLNKPINDPKSVVLYRNDKPIDSNDSPIVAVLNDNDNAVIDVIMKKLKPEDTGKYKLCLKSPETGKEVELASTNLTVNEEPIKVVEPLKADKDQYEEGNDVTLTVKLSKQLKDKDSCALWSSENKQLEDGVRKNIEKGEFKAEDNVFVYYLKIKSSQAKPDSGVYSLRLLSKPNESQSEFYNGTANVKIEETPLTVLESNWKPETVKDETDDLKLSLKLNKPINDPKSVVLYRNDKPIDSNDSPIVAVLNDNDNAVIDVIMKKLKPEDTGKYKLCLKSPETGKEVELASTNLTVNEEPIKVVEPLKADKDQYEEGNDVTLTVKLSKQLKDKDSCALWSSENKQLEDGVRKNIEKGEFKAEDNVFVYYLKIKSSQAKPDSGVYSLRLLSKPNESQSEFYNGTANVIINEKSLPEVEQLEKASVSFKVIESICDIYVDEGETAKFIFSTSGPCSVNWYKIEGYYIDISVLEENPNLVRDDERFFVIFEDDRTVISSKDNVYSLCIHDSILSDGSAYLCCVNGSTFMTANLIVKELPLYFVKKFPVEVSVQESNELVLEGKFNRCIPNLESKIKIFMNDICINSADVAFKFSFDGSFGLTKKSVKTFDSGLYSLVFGELKTFCKVTVLSESIDEAAILKPPKIIEDLSEEIVLSKDTENVELVILVECDEDTKATWFFNDTPIDDVQIENLSDSIFKIKLNINLSPIENKLGYYYCKVCNNAGSVMSRTACIRIDNNISVDDVIVETKPRFIEYFNDIYVERNNNAKFTCKIVGNPNPTITWFYNYRKIVQNDKYIIEENNDNYYTLKLINIQDDDDGEYTCKAVNSKGEVSWSANLFVNENSNKVAEPSTSNLNYMAPVFLRKFRDITVLENEDCKFNCFIDGFPFPIVKIFRQDKPIDFSNSNKYNLEIQKESGSIVFEIHNCSEDDQSEYVIRIENEAGKAECQASLIIEKTEDKNKSKNRKVRFSLPLEAEKCLVNTQNETELPLPPGQPSIEYINYQSLVLNWIQSPSDPRNYEEEKNYPLVNYDTNAVITYIVEYKTSKSYSWTMLYADIRGLSVLVDSLTQGLVYSFRIRAENNFGISDASPTVSTKKQIQQLQKQMNQETVIQPVSDSVSVYGKPSITADSYDIRYFIEGQTAIVSILVLGSPNPITKWIRNEDDLNNSDKYNIYSDRFGYHTIEIANPTEKDEGPYEIVAINEIGIAKHTFFLQQADPPIFLEPFTDVTIHNHEDVQLICKVDGIPYPEVKFYKDWRLLAESHRIRITHPDAETWIITIKQAIVRDSGLYTCTAKNIAGSTFSSCNLNVADSLLNSPRPDLRTDLILFKNKKFEEDYDIVKEISRSPNAIFFKVVERRTAKDYVAKVVFDTKFVNWAKNEADCLNELNHSSNKNFVQLHDAYEAPNNISILVFEEIKGRDVIESLMSLGKYDETKVALYMKQLLECIKELHSRNIAHLDINPDHVIIESNKLKLIGFTHAKSLKPDLFKNKNYEHIYHDYGNPEFAAPEIVLQQPITLNTDMWSAGVMAYVLLTGKSPFYSDGVKDSLTNVANCNWNFSEEFINVSHEAKDFIQKLLTKDPKERMTVEEALNHEWISYATHKVPNVDLNKDSLMQYYSRRLWDSNLKKNEPWKKLVRVSDLLKDTDVSDLKSIYEQLHLKKQDNDSQMELKSYSDILNNELDDNESFCENNNDEDGNPIPGAYLIPVKDPFFTVRMRDYRRKRYEKNLQLEKSPTRSAINLRDRREFNYKPIKERYHVDTYGKYLRGGSLSRTTKASFEREHSIRRSLSRASVESVRSGNSTVNHIIDKSFVTRQINGIGCAPIFRQKLYNVCFQTGSSVCLHCRVEGNPIPRTVWYFNDHLLVDDNDRIKFTQAENGVVTLTINKTRVSDIGIYKCVAQNSHGMVTTKAKLEIGDCPDKPSRPFVSQYTSNEVYLVWDGPSFNGNSDILCYKVDYKIFNDVKWINALYTIEECCLIKNLAPNTKYRFRVSCINTIGISAYSWASEEITTLNSGVGKILIDNEMAEKLLNNQYTLEKRSQQPKLVRKLVEETVNSTEAMVHEIKIRANENMDDYYTLENMIFDHHFNCIEKKTNIKRLVKYINKNNLKEISIIKTISNNERILKLTDVFEDSNRYSLVYTHSIPIIDFLTFKHKYSEELVVRIMRQLIDAIQWLHLNGVAHLNVSPMSIFNSNFTNVNLKLCGFDNATKLGKYKNAFQPLHLQNIEFSAPEIVCKEELCYESDVWSIGVFTALLLSGSSLFMHHGDKENTIENIKYCRIQFEEFYDNVTGEAVLFIQQCLKRCPSNRLTIEQCLNHKLFDLSVLNCRKREKILFLSEKLKSFKYEHRKRLQEWLE